MSDRFWDHFNGQQGGLLDNGTTDDGSYQPWVAVSSHSDEMPAKLLLVPARHASPKTYRIPYLQIMLHEFNRETGQLCLMFPGSGRTVFIEGRGLEQLDELIDKRQVKSIHMFDPDIHSPVGNGGPIVTKITVENG